MICFWNLKRTKEIIHVRLRKGEWLPWSLFEYYEYSSHGHSCRSMYDECKSYE